MILRNWKKIEWHSIFQKSSGDRQGVYFNEKQSDMNKIKMHFWSVINAGMACLKIKSWLDFNVKRHCALAATIHKIDGNHTHHSIPITIHIRIFIPLTPQTECTLELYNFCWCTLICIFTKCFFKRCMKIRVFLQRGFQTIMEW